MKKIAGFTQGVATTIGFILGIGFLLERSCRMMFTTKPDKWNSYMESFKSPVNKDEDDSTK